MLLHYSPIKTEIPDRKKNGKCQAGFNEKALGTIQIYFK